MEIRFKRNIEKATAAFPNAHFVTDQELACITPEEPDNFEKAVKMLAQAGRTPRKVQINPGRMRVVLIA